MDKRIHFLDGIRGLAILLVVLFHTFSAHSDVLPYEEYKDIIIFKYGFLGVQLFFLLSGFVILMTLEKSKSFWNFIYKRWLRLFPAMLIVSVLLYLIVSFLFPRKTEQPNIYSLIPGLLFIEPGIIGSVLKTNIIVLEQSFWSLYIEMKFYIVIGICYFMFGRKKALLCLILLFSYSLLNTIYPLHHFNYTLLVLSCFGWFVSGCLAYIYYIEKRKRYLFFSIIMGLLTLYTTYKLRQASLDYFLTGIVVISIFYITVCYEKSRFILANRFFLFLGFISYPLYLIHENTIVSATDELLTIFPFLPKLLVPFFPITILCIVTYVIAKLEPLLKNKIDKTIRKIQFINKIVS